MTDAEFYCFIRRIRRRHWLHYPAQALLMGGVVLAAGQRTASGATLEPQLATWPALLALGAVLPLVGVVLYGISRYMRPNLRRPVAENLRIYQSRVLLRNSLLGLLAMPLLASYVLTHRATDLALCGIMLVALSWQTAPSARTYQRWLLR